MEAGIAELKNLRVLDADAIYVKCQTTVLTVYNFTSQTKETSF